MIYETIKHQLFSGKLVDADGYIKARKQDLYRDILGQDYPFGPASCVVETG